MKIYTGYFAQIKKYREAGLETISIARFNRYYIGKSMKILAPSADMIHDPKPDYIPKYNRILSRLSKEGILKEISLLSGGKDVVLLCYEKPGDFCHRTLVAKWLSEITDVKEFETKRIDPQLF